MPQGSSKFDASQDETGLLRKKQTTKIASKSHENSSIRERLIAGLDEDRRLAELIRIVALEGGFKIDDVARELMSLEDEGVVFLQESRNDPTLAWYISSPESSWFTSSIVIVAASIALVFLPPFLPGFLLEPLLYARYFIGSILVLFLPGYSFLQALYTIKSPFDDLTRYALSLVMSLALVILISLILGGSPVGLNTFPITISLSLFIVIMLLIGVKKRFDYYEIAHHFD